MPPCGWMKMKAPSSSAAAQNGSSAGIVEIAAVDVGADHGAAQAELGHGPAQFGRGLLRRLQRHAAEADETVGLSFDDAGDLFILDCGAREPERRLAVVEESEHRRRQHLHVDAVGVHVAQAHAEIPDFRGHRVLHHAAVDLENDLRRADALEHRRDLRRFLGDEAHRLLGEDVGVRIDGTDFRSALQVTLPWPRRSSRPA